MYEGMEVMDLEHEGTLLRGYVARPEGEGPFPAVLVMHSAIGIAHGVNEPAARRLAAEGYVAVCTDMYGADLFGAGAAEYGRIYHDLQVVNPAKQRDRTVAWHAAVAGRPDVDPGRIAAIGFCYGGTTALELARSGADLRAAVSYHGILTTYRPAEAGRIKAQVAVYCGAGDPWAPPEEVDGFHREMLDAGYRDYQLTVFGAADHGFTDPEAAAMNREGVVYHDLSNHLSWRGTIALLEHVFR